MSAPDLPAAWAVPRAMPAQLAARVGVAIATARRKEAARVWVQSLKVAVCSPRNRAGRRSSSAMPCAFGGRTMNPGYGIILWIVIGALAGWVGSKIMGTDARQGGVANIIIGMIGEVVGGF